MRPFSRFSLAAVTATAMGVATFGQAGFGVIAADLIAEFSIERWQIGALVSASGFTGALLSPMFGRVTDRLGSVKSVTGVLLVAMAAMALISVSPSYIVLFGGAILTGLPNGWTNPATNALIVDNIAAGARGFITGIKQSGVQAGAFLGGLLLPPISNLAGWRVAWASFLVFPIIALVAMWRRPEVKREPRAAGMPKAPIPTAVKWIAVYGTLTGLGVSSTTTFLPLFAQEDQGWTKAQAGLLIAGVGLVGVIARITWGSVSERWLGHGRTLRLLGAQSAVGAILLALAASGNTPSWVLVPTALLFGSGAVAWNAVGMLAVMDYSVPELVGRGTGLAMLGFLTGIGLGAPLMGLSVDRLGVYTPGWLVLAGLFALSTLVAGRIQRTGTLAHI
ncbi:MAG TPA: MFS transporter [Acidimicrobiia bacterium]|nr:MFS transporter [Acidimicrobiia bacterium]